MKFLVKTCNGYRVEEVQSTIERAIAACRRREKDSADGFARVVELNGRHVADAEGVYPQYREFDPMDVAMERRHDRLDGSL